MMQHNQKVIISIILLATHCLVLAGNCFAEELTVTLVINPKKTDVYLGSAPIALTAKAKGKNLIFKWELIGPGKLDGKSSAMFYTLPKTIAGDSAQAVITVIVIDETGQEVRESVTFNILPRLPTPTPTVTSPTTKKGMGMGTKIILGAGAIAALGGGIALAIDNGGDGSAVSGIEVGGYIWYLGAEGESCTQVCSSHGGYHEATRTYAGSEAADWRSCERVLRALQAPGVETFFDLDKDSTSCGCYAHRWSWGWGWAQGIFYTTADCSNIGSRRACACIQ